MSESTPEKHAFQAEIQQLLDLVVHSLYTDKEIFLRELISNASDAMEKLRHVEATEKNIHQPTLPLEIRIETDESARTLTIMDHGIGMSHEELVKNLGTIAHSGTKAFLQSLKEGGAKPGSMIGQFGVGFYSAFMVADKVAVHTRSWHADSPELVWTSDGKSGYEIEETSGLDRGSKLVLHLKEDCAEYATEARVRHLIQTYSNFVGFPILLNGKRINEVEALWLKNKSEITDDQYKAFYQFACKAWDEPSYRLHFSADAPLAINSLVFAPSENPERMGFAKAECAVALYSRKVLIDPSPKELLPDWMRFMKGVVDSADIPLNISRETMQDSALIRKLGSVISKRVIRMFEKEAEADPSKFRDFYRQIGDHDLTLRDQDKLLGFNRQAGIAQRVGHGSQLIGRGVDQVPVLVALDIGSTGVDCCFHQGFLVDGIGRNADFTLAFELIGDTPLGGDRSAVLAEDRTHVGGRAVQVVGGHFNDESDTGRSVSFV